MFFNIIDKNKKYKKNIAKIIIESYKNCQLIFKAYSKSYYLGGHFFYYDKFKKICAIYTFLRIIDNEIDSNLALEEKNKILKNLKMYF